MKKSLQYVELNHGTFIKGGKVAMYLALNNVSLVSKLVVVDVAPIRYPWQGGQSHNVLQAMLDLEEEMHKIQSLQDAHRAFEPKLKV
jgi:hypothetical protein